MDRETLSMGTSNRPRSQHCERLSPTVSSRASILSASGFNGLMYLLLFASVAWLNKRQQLQEKTDSSNLRLNVRRPTHLFRNKASGRS